MKRSIIATCWLLLASGCINLDPPADPTRYFIMNGPEVTADQPGYAVDVKPVTVEPYLESPRMVVRLDDNELRFSDVNRWSEPLGENLRSVLSEHLALSPIGRVENRSGEGPRLIVRVHVHHFEGRLPDQARLDATWTVEDASGALIVRRRSEHVVSGWGGVDYEQLTGLLEETVALLADEIASAV